MGGRGGGRRSGGGGADGGGRSADDVATAVWLIPFHHTEHCALHADKNTQSNKQREKRGGEDVKIPHNSI